MTNKEKSWENQVQLYCEKYNIPISYLSDILSEPKVIPMIRGKAFEFSAMLRLQEILPKSDWIVDKPIMNAQFGYHDIDVRVIHKKTKAIIGIECKLAAKGSFRINKNGDIFMKVKCMRSRTLGENKANEVAQKLNINGELLKIHNDQYLPTDFDVVITSIANAFYQTNKETEIFDWHPSTEETIFLEKVLRCNDADMLQNKAYQHLYLAQSKDLAILEKNNLTCSRKQCTDPQNCGFIPNYPTIFFEKDTYRALKPWVIVDEAVDFFLQMIK